MRKTLVGIYLTWWFLLPTLVAQEAPIGKVAFIKDNEIYTANADGSGALRLTQDGAQKNPPRWSTDGNRLAYQRKVERERALAEARVIYADGRPVREILFRPPGSGMGMRGVERMWWSNGSQLVLLGSSNPNDCEYVAISVDTGQTIADYGGFCPSFVESPDKSHIAYASMVGIFGGPEGNLPSRLEIDGREIYPAKGVASTGRFLSGLRWSADSKSVAVLELDVPSAVTYATVATVSGAVTRTPLPAFLEMPMDLTWAGNSLLLEAGAQRFQIDIAAKALRLAGPDEEERLSRDTEARRVAEGARKLALAVARRLGAKSDEDIDVFVPAAQP